MITTDEAIAKYAGELRAPVFKTIVDLARQRKLKSIVETGCVRTWPGCPDGASTIVLAALTEEKKGFFASYDICPAHTATAEAALVELGLFKHSYVHNKDSIDGISDLHCAIDIAYLDSWDFVPPYELSQVHCLAEAVLVYTMLSPNGIIAVDDCVGDLGGKVKLAHLFLTHRGFKLCYDGYGRVYSR